MTMRPLCAILCLFLAGCATATIEDAVPAGALAENAVQSAPSTAGQGAADDNYPSLSAEPPAAAQQITDEQKASETAALRARRQQLSGAAGGPSAAVSQAELQRLAQSHGEEVLRQIESE